MYEKIDFSKLNDKTIDHIEPCTNWRETEYTDITIYFKDGTSLTISAGGEEGYLSIYN